MDISAICASPLLPVGAGLAIIGAGVIAIKRLLNSNDDILAHDPPNTVILCQFFRGPYAPSFSPFCLKLETYLRMAKIPYKNYFGLKFSSKGKMPFIRYNGIPVADSQFCIEFIKKKFDVDLDSTLTESERGVSTAFLHLLEDSLNWYMLLERWVHSPDNPWLVEAKVPRFFRWFFPRQVGKAAHFHGMGRHTKEEVQSIAAKDIDAIASFLGSKQFLMGSDPTEVDCATFGFLVQLTYNTRGSFSDVYITENHPQLLDYCERMKHRFWPDWEKCITNGGRKQAVK